MAGVPSALVSVPRMIDGESAASSTTIVAPSATANVSAEERLVFWWAYWLMPLGNRTFTLYVPGTTPT